MSVETRKNSQTGGNAGQSLRDAAETLREGVGNALERGKSDLSASADAARQTLSEDIAQLRADLQQLQKTVASFASDAGGAAASTARGVGQAVSSVTSEAAAAATDQAKTVASELEGMARRNPLGTLAGTLLVGVALGMMSRGRK